MLLTRREKPFNSQDYIFEFKWDGFRCIYFINTDNPFLQSRNGNNLLPYFPELREIYNYIKVKKMIVDGEICFFSQNGKLDFSILQKRLKSKNTVSMSDKYPVTLIVWDILCKDNQEVYQLPLYKRKKILNKIIIEENSLIQLSPYINYSGKELYEKAKKMKMEGIVAKNRNSPYEFKRSKFWLKIKIWKYMNVVIGGYTPGKTALIVGKSKNNSELLTYMGKIKLALPREEKIALFKILPELKTGRQIFLNLPADTKLFRVKPVIKCRVKYSEITHHNMFRHGHAVKLLI